MARDSVIQHYSQENYYCFNHNELDEEYLRHCPIKQIIRQLEFNDAIFMFVSDLKYSIEKQYQDTIQLAQWNIQNRQSFSRVLLIESQLLRDYKDLIKWEDKLNSKIERLFKVLLIQRGGYKNILNRNKKVSSGEKCFNQINSFLQSKLWQSCSYHYKKAENRNNEKQSIPQHNETDEQLDQQYYLINDQTCGFYLESLKKFLIHDNYEISLYNYLKNIVYKWILEHYKEQVKNEINILGLTQNYYSLELREIKKITKEQYEQNGQEKRLEKQNGKIKQSNDPLLMGTNLVINKKSNGQVVNGEKKDSLLVQLYDQLSKINIHSLIHAPLVKVVDLHKICCVNFFYDFSTIQANKYNVHPSLAVNVIILRDGQSEQTSKLKDNANQNTKITNANQSKAKFSSAQATPSPSSVSQAVCALLNNQGGYILIGFQKNREFYKIASQSTNEKLLTENQYYSLIKKSFPKFWEDEKFRTMIKIDYIPVVKRSRPKSGKEYLWQLKQKQIKFICRIKVEPKDEYQRMLYYIGGQKNEKGSVEGKFLTYDIMKQDLKSQQLFGQEIYKKLKQIQKQFGTCSISGKKASYKSLNKNQLKITNHLEQKCKNVDQRFPNLILPYIAKINAQSGQKQLAAQTNPADRLKIKQNKETIKQQAQQQKEQFKYVNIVVLENKALKMLIQQMFKEKLFSTKIQKLDTRLKKLSKTTYIIHHNKKFEEINSQLNEFKKSGTNSKKALLISAEKSIFLEKLLDSEKLELINKMFKQENRKDVEKLQYVEDPKDSKSYIRAETKLGGIYLYFIATEIDIKSRMKNVPQYLVNSLMDIQIAIQRKKVQQLKYKQVNSSADPQVSNKNYRKRNIESQNMRQQSLHINNNNNNSSKKNKYSQYKSNSEFQNRNNSNNERNYNRNFSNIGVYNSNSNDSYYNQYSQANSNSNRYSYQTAYSNMNIGNNNYPYTGYNHNQLYFQTYGSYPPYDVIYNYTTGLWQYIGQNYQQNTYSQENDTQNNQFNNKKQQYQNYQNKQTNPKQQSSINNSNKDEDKNEIKQEKQFQERQQRQHRQSQKRQQRQYR